MIYTKVLYFDEVPDGWRRILKREQDILTSGFGIGVHWWRKEQRWGDGGKALWQAQSDVVVAYLKF